MHELATNGTKYGSLSADGRVDIEWSNDPTETGNGFHFTWTESGGPSVKEPTRKGFGSRLIEKILANDFGGEVRTFYHPGGVVVELVAPMDTFFNSSKRFVMIIGRTSHRQKLVLVVEDDFLLRMDAVQMIEEQASTLWRLLTRTMQS